MKTLLTGALLVLSTLPAAAASDRFVLRCAESYLDDFIPIVRRLEKEIPIHVITDEDVGNGTHIGRDVGTLGGALDETFHGFKLSARVTRLVPWLMIQFPDGTGIFNGVSAPDYSQLGGFPNSGKTAHKILCEIERKPETAPPHNGS